MKRNNFLNEQQKNDSVLLGESNAQQFQQKEENNINHSLMGIKREVHMNKNVANELQKIQQQKMVFDPDFNPNDALSSEKSDHNIGDDLADLLGLNEWQMTQENAQYRQREDEMAHEKLLQQIVTKQKELTELQNAKKLDIGNNNEYSANQKQIKINILQEEINGLQNRVKKTDNVIQQHKNSNANAVDLVNDMLRNNNQVYHEPENIANNQNKGNQRRERGNKKKQNDNFDEIIDERKFDNSVDKEELDQNINKQRQKIKQEVKNDYDQRYGLNVEDLPDALKTYVAQMDKITKAMEKEEEKSNVEGGKQVVSNKNQAMKTKIQQVMNNIKGMSKDRASQWMQEAENKKWLEELEGWLNINNKPAKEEELIGDENDRQKSFQGVVKEGDSELDDDSFVLMDEEDENRQDINNFTQKPVDNNNVLQQRRTNVNQRLSSMPGNQQDLTVLQQKQSLKQKLEPINKHGGQSNSEEDMEFKRKADGGQTTITVIPQQEKGFLDNIVDNIKELFTGVEEQSGEIVVSHVPKGANKNKLMGANPIGSYQSPRTHNMQSLQGHVEQDGGGGDQQLLDNIEYSKAKYGVLDEEIKDLQKALSLNIGNNNRYTSNPNNKIEAKLYDELGGASRNVARANSEEEKFPLMLRHYGLLIKANNAIYDTQKDKDKQQETLITLTQKYKRLVRDNEKILKDNAHYLQNTLTEAIYNGDSYKKIQLQFNQIKESYHSKCLIIDQMKEGEILSNAEALVNEEGEIIIDAKNKTPKKSGILLLWDNIKAIKEEEDEAAKTNGLVFKTRRTEAASSERLRVLNYLTAIGNSHKSTMERKDRELKIVTQSFVNKATKAKEINTTILPSALNLNLQQNNKISQLNPATYRQGDNLTEHTEEDVAITDHSDNHALRFNPSTIPSQQQQGNLNRQIQRGIPLNLGGLNNNNLDNSNTDRTLPPPSGGNNANQGTRSMFNGGGQDRRNSSTSHVSLPSGNEEITNEDEDDDNVHPLNNEKKGEDEDSQETGHFGNHLPKKDQQFMSFQVSRQPSNEINDDIMVTEEDTQGIQLDELHKGLMTHDVDEPFNIEKYFDEAIEMVDKWHNSLTATITDKKLIVQPRDAAKKWLNAMKEWQKKNSLPLNRGPKPDIQISGNELIFYSSEQLEEIGGFRDACNKLITAGAQTYNEIENMDSKQYIQYKNTEDTSQAAIDSAEKEMRAFEGKIPKNILDISIKNITRCTQDSNTWSKNRDMYERPTTPQWSVNTYTFDYNGKLVKIPKPKVNRGQMDFFLSDVTKKLHNIYKWHNEQNTQWTNEGKSTFCNNIVAVFRNTLPDVAKNKELFRQFDSHLHQLIYDCKYWNDYHAIEEFRPLIKYENDQFVYTALDYKELFWSYAELELNSITPEVAVAKEIDEQALLSHLNHIMNSIVNAYLDLINNDQNAVVAFIEPVKKWTSKVQEWKTKGDLLIPLPRIKRVGDKFIVLTEEEAKEEDIEIAEFKTYILFAISSAGHDKTMPTHVDEGDFADMDEEIGKYISRSEIEGHVKKWTGLSEKTLKSLDSIYLYLEHVEKWKSDKQKYQQPIQPNWDDNAKTFRYDGRLEEIISPQEQFIGKIFISLQKLYDEVDTNTIQSLNQCCHALYNDIEQVYAENNLPHQYYSLQNIGYWMKALENYKQGQRNKPKMIQCRKNNEFIYFSRQEMLYAFIEQELYNIKKKANNNQLLSNEWIALMQNTADMWNTILPSDHPMHKEDLDKNDSMKPIKEWFGDFVAWNQKGRQGIEPIIEYRNGAFVYTNIKQVRDKGSKGWDWKKGKWVTGVANLLTDALNDLDNKKIDDKIEFQDIHKESWDNALDIIAIKSSAMITRLKKIEAEGKMNDEINKCILGVENKWTIASSLNTSSHITVLCAKLIALESAIAAQEKKPPKQEIDPEIKKQYDDIKKGVWFSNIHQDPNSQIYRQLKDLEENNIELQDIIKDIKEFEKEPVKMNSIIMDKINNLTSNIKDNKITKIRKQRQDLTDKLQKDSSFDNVANQELLKKADQLLKKDLKDTTISELNNLLGEMNDVLRDTTKSKRKFSVRSGSDISDTSEISDDPLPQDVLKGFDDFFSKIKNGTAPNGKKLSPEELERYRKLEKRYRYLQTKLQNSALLDLQDLENIKELQKDIDQFGGEIGVLLKKPKKDKQDKRGVEKLYGRDRGDKGSEVKVGGDEEKKERDNIARILKATRGKAGGDEKNRQDFNDEFEEKTEKFLDNERIYEFILKYETKKGITKLEEEIGNGKVKKFEFQVRDPRKPIHEVNPNKNESENEARKRLKMEYPGLDEELLKLFIKYRNDKSPQDIILDLMAKVQMIETIENSDMDKTGTKEFEARMDQTINNIEAEVDKDIAITTKFLQDATKKEIEEEIKRVNKLIRDDINGKVRNTTGELVEHKTFNRATKKDKEALSKSYLGLLRARIADLDEVKTSSQGEIEKSKQEVAKKKSKELEEAEENLKKSDHLNDKIIDGEIAETNRKIIEAEGTDGKSGSVNDPSQAYYHRFIREELEKNKEKLKHLNEVKKIHDEISTAEKNHREASKKAKEAKKYLDSARKDYLKSNHEDDKKTIKDARQRSDKAEKDLAIAEEALEGALSVNSLESLEEAIAKVSKEIVNKTKELNESSKEDQEEAERIRQQLSQMKKEFEAAEADKKKLEDLQDKLAKIKEEVTKNDKGVDFTKEKIEEAHKIIDVEKKTIELEEINAAKDEIEDSKEVKGLKEYQKAFPVEMKKIHNAIEKIKKASDDIAAYRKKKKIKDGDTDAKIDDYMKSIATNLTPITDILNDLATKKIITQEYADDITPDRLIKGAGKGINDHIIGAIEAKIKADQDLYVIQLQKEKEDRIKKAEGSLKEASEKAGLDKKDSVQEKQKLEAAEKVVKAGLKKSELEQAEAESKALDGEIDQINLSIQKMQTLPDLLQKHLQDWIDYAKKASALHKDIATWDHADKLVNGNAHATEINNAFKSIKDIQEQASIALKDLINTGALTDKVLKISLDGSYNEQAIKKTEQGRREEIQGTINQQEQALQEKTDEKIIKLKNIQDITGKLNDALKEAALNDKNELTDEKFKEAQKIIDTAKDKSATTLQEKIKAAKKAIAAKKRDEEMRDLIIKVDAAEKDASMQAREKRVKKAEKDFVDKEKELQALNDPQTAINEMQENLKITEEHLAATKTLKKLMKPRELMTAKAFVDLENAKKNLEDVENKFNEILPSTTKAKLEFQEAEEEYRKQLVAINNKITVNRGELIKNNPALQKAKVTRDKKTSDGEKTVKINTIKKSIAAMIGGDSAARLIQKFSNAKDREGVFKEVMRGAPKGNLYLITRYVNAAKRMSQEDIDNIKNKKLREAILELKTNIKNKKKHPEIIARIYRYMSDPKAKAPTITKVAHGEIDEKGKIDYASIFTRQEMEMVNSNIYVKAGVKGIEGGKDRDGNRTVILICHKIKEIENSDYFHEIGMGTKDDKGLSTSLKNGQKMKITEHRVPFELKLVRDLDAHDMNKLMESREFRAMLRDEDFADRFFDEVSDNTNYYARKIVESYKIIYGFNISNKPRSYGDIEDTADSDRENDKGKEGQKRKDLQEKEVTKKIEETVKAVEKEKDIRIKELEKERKNNINITINLTEKLKEERNRLKKLEFQLQQSGHGDKNSEDERLKTEMDLKNELEEKENIIKRIQEKHNIEINEIRTTSEENARKQKEEIEKLKKKQKEEKEKEKDDKKKQEEEAKEDLDKLRKKLEKTDEQQEKDMKAQKEKDAQKIKELEEQHKDSTKTKEEKDLEIKNLKQKQEDDMKIAILEFEKNKKKSDEEKRQEIEKLKKKQEIEIKTLEENNRKREEFDKQEIRRLTLISQTEQNDAHNKIQNLENKLLEEKHKHQLELDQEKQKAFKYQQEKQDMKETLDDQTHKMQLLRQQQKNELIEIDQLKYSIKLQEEQMKQMQKNGNNISQEQYRQLQYELQQQKFVLEQKNKNQQDTEWQYKQLQNQQQQTLQELQQIKNELVNEKHKNQQINNEKNRLNNDLNTHKDNERILRQQNIQRDTEIQRLQNEINEREVIINKRDTTEQDKIRLQEELDQRRNSVQTLERDKQQAEYKIKQLEDNIKKIMNDLEEERRRNKKMMETNQNLTQENERMTKELRQSETQYKRLINSQSRVNNDYYDVYNDNEEEEEKDIKEEQNQEGNGMFSKVGNFFSGLFSNNKPNQIPENYFPVSGYPKQGGGQQQDYNTSHLVQNTSSLLNHHRAQQEQIGIELLHTNTATNTIQKGSYGQPLYPGETERITVQNEKQAEQIKNQIYKSNYADKTHVIDHATYQGGVENTHMRAVQPVTHSIIQGQSNRIISPILNSHSQQPSNQLQLYQQPQQTLVQRNAALLQNPYAQQSQYQSSQPIKTENRIAVRDINGKLHNNFNSANQSNRQTNSAIKQQTVNQSYVPTRINNIQLRGPLNKN